MIVIERLEVEQIPVLLMAKSSLQSKPLPTVFYYHGFNGEKESSLTIAYKMAEKGIRVILPDAPLHGERAISEDSIEHGVTFWNIVTDALQEIKSLYEYLKKKQLILDDRIGFGGTSMGGMITYAALTKYDWIKSAAVLMGTPYITERAKQTMQGASEFDEVKLREVKKFDLTKQVEKLNNRPLFIWHGELDQIVPVEDSRKFYKEVQSKYTKEEDLQFIEEKDRIHNISKLSIRKTAEWFERKL